MANTIDAKYGNIITARSGKTNFKKREVIVISQEEIREKTIGKRGAGYLVFNICRKIFIYLLALMIVIGALLFASNRSPDKTLFGYRYYTVLTPSMLPTYDTGDMVFVRRTRSEEIAVGDVITFNPSAGAEAYLTHRVTEKLTDYQGTGVTCFRTKGDANNSEDTFLIDESRVIGVVGFSVPKLGYVIRFLQLKWYYIVPLLLLTILFFRLLRIYFGTDDEEEEESKAAVQKSGKITQQAG